MMQIASAQLIRIVTDKVMETVMQQVAARQVATPATVVSAPSDEVVAAMVNAQVNRQLAELLTRFEAVATQTERVDARLTRMERRWGWAMMMRIGSIVFLALLIGIAIGVIARAGGWF